MAQQLELMVEWHKKKGPAVTLTQSRMATPVMSNNYSHSEGADKGAVI